ncbi:hypothetical protein ACQJBY_025632 [Aegilops geniculata]
MELPTQIVVGCYKKGGSSARISIRSVLDEASNVDTEFAAGRSADFAGGRRSAEFGEGRRTAVELSNVACVGYSRSVYTLDPCFELFFCPLFLCVCIFCMCIATAAETLYMERHICEPVHVQSWLLATCWIDPSGRKVDSLKAINWLQSKRNRSTSLQAKSFSKPRVMQIVVCSYIAIYSDLSIEWF